MARGGQTQNGGTADPGHRRTRGARGTVGGGPRATETGERLMAIVRRGDKYGVRVWVDGRHRWLGTFATRAEAKRAEASATVQPIAGSTMTVEQWARIWLERYARPAAATRRTYGYAIGRVLRDIGELRLAAIDR